MGVSRYFEQICGIDDIYASSKEGIAVEWRKQNPDLKVLFIGDTDHDCDVARAMGADCALVAQGHQSFEALTGYASDAAVFKNMKELKDYLC